MGFLTEQGLSVSGVSALLVLLFLFGCIAFGLTLTFFLIKAVALFEMAKKKKIKHEWFAFVPLLNLLISGKLSNIYIKEKSGKKGHFEKSLILNALLVAVFIIMSIISLTVSFVSIIFAADSAVSQNVPLGSLLTFPVIQSGILLILTAILLLIYKIQRTIVFNKILSLFKVKCAVVITAVCFFLPFLAPFFLMSASKNEIDEQI